MTKRCNICEHLIQTNTNNRAMWFCEECHASVKYQSLRVKIAKQKYTQLIKLERGCEAVDGCEYTQQGQQVTHGMFDFDHINPTIKLTEVSQMYVSGRYSFDDIKKEISKCRVVCKMHHVLITEKQWSARAKKTLAQSMLKSA